MALQERYIPRQKVMVNSHTVPDIQGVSTIPDDLPFVTTVIPALSFVTKPIDGETLQDESFPKAITIGDSHGRSDELLFTQNGNVWWKDGYGILYSTFSQKGAKLDDAVIYKSETSPSGFMISGLQESDSIKRTVLASEEMRKNGVEAEMILRVLEPLELPLGEEIVSLDEFKRQLLIRLAKGNNKAKSDDFPLELATAEDLPKVAKWFSESTFYITIRGQQVPERLADIASCETQEELKAVLKNAFRFINFKEKRLGEKDPGYTPAFFDIENPHDISRYLLEYLPRQIAQNYAKLHKAGLIHVYSTTHNVSTVGSLYDHDSVRGKIPEIDTFIPSNSDTKEDLKYLLHRRGIDSGLFPLYAALFENGLLPVTKEKFIESIQNFYKEYSQARFNTESTVTSLVQVYELLHPELVESSASLNMIAEAVCAELGWEYENPQYLQTLLARFSDISEREIQLVLEGRDPMEIWDEISYSETAPGIYLNDLGGCITFLKMDIYGSHDERIQKIILEYGEETALLVGDLFAKYELFRGLNEFATKQQEERFHTYLSFRTIQTQTRNKDIITYLPIIDGIYKQFSSPITHQLLEYYCLQIENKLGWKYERAESVGDLIQEWKASEKEVEQLESLGNPLDRFKNWSYDELPRKIRQTHKHELRKITRKYGKKVTDTLVLWLAFREDNRLASTITEEDL